MNSNSTEPAFIPFITFNSFGKMVINPATISFLKGLPSPVSLVSICGPRNTGKSFLLKQLLNSTELLDGKDPSIEPTQHISIYSKPYLIYT